MECSLPDTAPLSKDSKGHPLRAWPFGRYCVAPGDRLGSLTSHHPRSFDDHRYFRSDIDCTAIRHRLKPFLASTMNARLRNSGTLGSALAMGLGVIDRASLGIVAAAAMPFVVLSARNSGWDAFKKRACLLYRRSLANRSRPGYALDSPRRW